MAGQDVVLLAGAEGGQGEGGPVDGHPAAVRPSGARQVGRGQAVAGTVEVRPGAAATNFVHHLDVPPAGQYVTTTTNSATVSITPPSPGPHTLYVYSVDGAGDDSGEFAYPFIAAGHPDATLSS
ncbi:hypothetical protein [Streptomyces sp. YKOK-I1]